jgi:predicted nucleic-acid-binding Zn-ribbon protein
MAVNEMECPKCKNEMEEGFLLDRTYGGNFPGKWIEGEPEKSFWTGTKTANKTQIDIATFRCVACGYLESYAR